MEGGAGDGAGVNRTAIMPAGIMYHLLGESVLSGVGPVWTMVMTSRWTSLSYGDYDPIRTESDLPLRIPVQDPSECCPNMVRIPVRIAPDP